MATDSAVAGNRIKGKTESGNREAGTQGEKDQNSNGQQTYCSLHSGIKGETHGKCNGKI